MGLHPGLQRVGIGKGGEGNWEGPRQEEKTEAAARTRLPGSEASLGVSVCLCVRLCVWRGYGGGGGVKPLAFTLLCPRSPRMLEDTGEGPPSGEPLGRRAEGRPAPPHSRRAPLPHVPGGGRGRSWGAGPAACRRWRRPSQLSCRTRTAR